MKVELRIVEFVDCLERRCEFVSNNIPRGERRYAEKLRAEELQDVRATAWRMMLDGLDIPVDHLPTTGPVEEGLPEHQRHGEFVIDYLKRSKLEMGNPSSIKLGFGRPESRKGD